jgi:hypothetical protein
MFLDETYAKFEPSAFTGHNMAECGCVLMFLILVSLGHAVALTTGRFLAQNSI